jgi:hypothetical protein
MDTEKIFIGQHYVSKSGKLSAVTVLEIAFGLIEVEEDLNGRQFWLSKKELFHTYERD